MVDAADVNSVSPPTSTYDVASHASPHIVAQSPRGVAPHHAEIPPHSRCNEASEAVVQRYSRDEFITFLPQIIVSVLAQVDDDIDMLTRTVVQERLQLLHLTASML